MGLETTVRKSQTRHRNYTFGFFLNEWYILQFMKPKVTIY